MKYNSISKTYYRKEQGKLQHYTKSSYSCNDCGAMFRAKIHSQSSKMRLITILVGLGISFMVIKFAPYLIPPSVLLITCYMFFYSTKKRTISIKPNKPKYGEIISVCVNCGSINISIRDRKGPKGSGKWVGPR